VLGETVSLERDPRAVLGPRAGEVDQLLRAPLANGLSRWQALRFGALLHDIAKPQTRAVTPEGRVTFMAHDRAGAELSAGIMARLRCSERLREQVSLLVRHHIRLGFLVHEMPLSRRAIYDYLEAVEPAGVDVTVLTVADRLATRGRRSEEAIAKHLDLARTMLGDALSWEATPPQPPLRGDELARELGLEPGPEIGRLLAELREAAYAEEISTREQALDRARALLAQ
jgi:putative nucleotidyltransferase with HDIG domain